MASPQRLLKITMFVKRRPELSEEVFNMHWSKHGELVSPIALRHGCVKYSQFHTPSSFTSIVDGMIPGMAPLGYDGYAEFLVSSIDNILALSSDEEYLAKIYPDEQYMFGDGQERWDRTSVTCGWEEVMIDNSRLTERATGEVGADWVVRHAVGNEPKTMLQAVAQLKK